MKFVLYGQYDPKVCVAAYRASDTGGCDFGYFELDCDPVLIAFRNGREIARTYDVTKIGDWVKNLVSETDSRGETPS